jgi:predicted nucleotidyltransferase
MTRADVITCLKSVEPALRALGVEGVYLFGSIARDDGREDSDVDIFVDPVPGARFGFERYFDIKEMIETALARSVDLGTRSMLHPTLRPIIEREAVRVL